MKVIPDSSLSPLTDQIVITGLGAVCSLGNSMKEISRGLTSGKSGIGEITDFDVGESGFLGAQVKNPPAIKTDIPPQLARSMGKHLSLLLASTEEALGGAGIGSGMFDPQDIGFFAGMGMVDYHVEDLLSAVLKSLNQSGDLDYDRFFPAGCREIYPLWPLGMLNNVVFCQVAIHFGLRGENCVFSPHGDAGIQAVAQAVKTLEEGKAKVALAGGVSEEISPLSLARAKLKGLIGPPEYKSGAGRPKGTTAGIVLGECGAMLVLEPLSGAIDRGANILARVLGFGFACEKDQGGDFASGQAIFSAIKGALSRAELSSDQIDLIMFGSLSQNELEAVREIFDMDLKAPVMVATAKTLGETFAAGPILNTAIGLNILNLAVLPRDIYAYLPLGGGPPRGPSNTGRVLINGISYEGRCASMIVEKTAGENI